MPEPSSSPNPIAFDAFISYNRADRKFAAALEHQLEKHHFLDSSSGQKRRLNVFRDEQDMVGNNYYESIDQQLKQSRKLIVVCSPAAARSRFVDDEVSRFIAERGVEHVMPLLLDGLADSELAADGESRQEKRAKAFPPSLSAAMEMPLAVDYRGFAGAGGRVDRGVWQQPWFMLLAGILEMNREQVEQRELKRRRKVLVIAFTLLSLVIVALSGLTAWALWQQSVAKKQTRVAMSQQLAALSRAEMEADVSRALLYSARALQFAETPQAMGALIDNLAQTDALQKVLHGHPTEILDVAISEDHTQVAAAGSCETGWGNSTCLSAPISHWSLPAGKALVSFGGQRGNIMSLAFNPDGKELVSLSDDGSAVLWDPGKGLALGYTEIAVDLPAVLDATFDPDGYLLLYDHSGYRLLQQSDFSSEPVEAVDAVFHEFYYPNRVRARRPPAMLVKAQGRTFEVVIANPAGISYSIPDDLVPLFESLDLDVDSHGNWVASVPNPLDNTELLGLDISADGRWIAVAGNVRSKQKKGRLFVIDARNQLLAHEIPLSDFAATGVAISPDGKRVAVGACTDALISISVRCRVGEISIWDIASGQAIEASLIRVNDRPGALEFNSDGRVLAVSSCSHRSVGAACEASQLSLWSMDLSARDPAAVVRSDRPITPTNAAPSRQISTPEHSGLRIGYARDRSTLEFFHGDQEEPVNIQQGHEGGTRVAVFNRDGNLIASGGDDATVKIWNRSGELVRTISDAHTSPVYALAFSADGKRLVSVDYDQSVILWDVATWRRVGGFTDSYEISALKFGYHSRLIATVSGYQVTLWDADRGLVVATLETGLEEFPQLNFSQDGVLDLTFRTHHVRWNLEASHLIALACERANRELSMKEWNVVSSGLDYEPICVNSN